MSFLLNTEFFKGQFQTTLEDKSKPKLKGKNTLEKYPLINYLTGIKINANPRLA